VQKKHPTEIEIPGLISSIELEPAEVLLSGQSIAVALHGDLSLAIQRLDEKLDQVLRHPQKLFVLNCVYASAEPGRSASPTVLDKVARLREMATQKDKSFAMVQCPQELREKLAGRWGSEDCFFPSLTQALQVMGGHLLDMKEELGLLARSVVEVFQSQFGAEVMPKKPLRLEAGVAEPLAAEVIGLMPLISPGAVGNLALCFRRSTLRDLGAKTFGEQLKESDPETAQLAAELTNMVLGCAKTELNSRGYGIAQALPQTFAANDGAKLTVEISRPSWIIEFQSPMGNFYLEISMKAVEG
jgi:CheY-specific phosphatase CheX